MAVELACLRKDVRLATGALVRPARAADLPELVGLLTDDILGVGREVAFLEQEEAYSAAFRAVDQDPRQALLVLEAGPKDRMHGRLLGMLQLTMIPGIAQQGLWRGQIEAVRIRADRRGDGLGAAFLHEATRRLQEAGCGLAQLTTNQQRSDAHRFYERLGWQQTHLGYKRRL